MPDNKPATMREKSLRWLEDPTSIAAAVTGVGLALVRIGDLLDDLRKMQERRDNGWDA